MTIKQKRIFYIILITLFFTISPLLIIYSLGFRFNQEQNKFQKTGALYIRSNPIGAEIIIDGKNTGLTTPNKITSLLPGEYNVEIQKLGYLKWQKKLEVKSYSTTFSENIYLFNDGISPINIESGPVKHFLVSPSRNKLIYTINNNNIDAYHLFYFTSFKSEKIELINPVKSFIKWSADEEKILFQNLNNSFSVINLSNQNQIINLSNIINLKFDQLVWDEQGSNVLWGVSNKILYKINLLELNYEKILTPEISYLLPTQEGHYFIYQDPLVDNLHFAFAEYKKFDSIVEISELPFSDNYQIKKYNDWLFVHDLNKQILYFLQFNDQKPQLYNALKSVKGYSYKNGWLLFWNDYEYWIYDLEKQNPQLLERLSTEILYVTWHPEANYLLVETKNQLKIIETDDRDKKNSYNILSPSLIINERITFDQKNETLVFVDEINGLEGIYYLQLQ